MAAATTVNAGLTGASSSRSSPAPSSTVATNRPSSNTAEHSGATNASGTRIVSPVASGRPPPRRPPCPATEDARQTGGVRAPTRLQLAAALALAFVCLAVGIATAGDVPGERALLAALRSGVDDQLDGAASVVDRLTDTVVLVVVAGVLVVALLSTGRRRAAVLLALSFGGAVALNPLVKELVDRPRPDVRAVLPEVSALSFPSGHATATMALALGVVLAVTGTRWVVVAVLAGVTLVVVTAAAQLLLAFHHPSDLLGGWLWGAAWTLAVWSAGAVRKRSGRAAGRLLAR
jgi:undecaprenyl-diphosphatase